MENEPESERQILEPQETAAPIPEPSSAEPSDDVSDAKPSGALRTGPLVACLVLLIVTNFAVLYLTNSRITDLEVRVASLSNSIDSKGAKPVSPAKASGPDRDQVYTVKTDGAPTKGVSSAPVTIVEMSDFQCPFCARVQPTLVKVQQVYKDNVRIVWKHLPLESLHPNAVSAAAAAEAAKEQGKFWEYHDKLFSNQNKLKEKDLRQYAVELGLDMAKFDADMTDPATTKRINDDAEEANALGVTGTPGFFINGRFLNGAQPFDSFATAINGELKRLNLPVPAAE